MTAFRVGLPAVILLAGVALVIAGGETATAIGVLLIGSAFLVALFNWLLRLAGSSEDDRAREAAAREHFGRTGRWPAPPPGREEGP